jgi:disulfide bond formation protein DsbB
MAKKYFLYFAWTLSCISTLVSLAISEIYGFSPCVLCWYQRVCLFPLTVILGVSVYYLDFGVKKYAAPLAFIGSAFALVNLLILIPGAGSLCSSGCHDIFKAGSALSIAVPALSFCNFIAIGFLILKAKNH